MENDRNLGPNYSYFYMNNAGHKCGPNTVQQLKNLVEQRLIQGNKN